MDYNTQDLDYSRNSGASEKMCTLVSVKRLETRTGNTEYRVQREASVESVTLATGDTAKSQSPESRCAVHAPWPLKAKKKLVPLRKKH